MCIKERVQIMQTTELFEAVQTGDVASVQRVLGAQPALVHAKNERSMSPLMLATYFGRRDVADLLIAHGADLDIFAAAALGKAERIKTLLKEDQSLISAYSPDGWTALHLAAHFGQVEAARTLIERGADAGARSRNGLTNMPLHAALAGRHNDMTRLLLAHGAEVNARQHGGFTPLHAAAQDGDRANVALLLEHGADPGAVTDEGKTRMLAEERGHTEVAQLLT
jgi:ankyrin repeat protein